MDILIHNLIALVPAIVALLVLSQILVTVVLRVSERVLRSSVLSGVTAEDRDAFRRRTRRRSLLVTALAAFALVAIALVASFLRIRALDVLKATFAKWQEQGAAALQARLTLSAGIALGALVLDITARGLAAALGRALTRSERLAGQRALLLETVARMRAALRAVIVLCAAVLVCSALEISPAAQRIVASGAYVIGGLYVSRALSRCGYVVIEALFGVSGKLTSLEGPLKHLGSLGHLSGVAKTATDYLIYVGATTYVADKLTPDTWVARAGMIGLRVIAIFFLSRIVVEVCVLFIREIFLSKQGEDLQGDHQRRMTLVPVAVGFIRYGIYFAALVMVLREAAIDPTPLLAGAGVIGVSIGLGAQAFVGDVVAGFFILFENLVLVGDLVEVGKVRGRVEEIGVRITKIRDDSGVLHALPNGEVRKVANHSKGYVNAVVDVRVAYDEDVKRVCALLKQVSDEVLVRETGATAPVDIKVQELTERAIRLRVSARAPPGKDDDVADAIRERAVEVLRAAGIGAPVQRGRGPEGTLRVGSASGGDKGEDEDNKPANPFKAKEAKEEEG